MPSVINSDNGVISGTSGLKTSGSNDGLLDFQSNGTRIAGITTSAFQVGTDNISAVNSMGFRNRIINGDMRIDQRNAGASVSLTTGVIYPVDRFGSNEDTDGTMTAEQVQVAPAGFTDSLVFTTGTADSSLGAAQYVGTFQLIEGFNVADFGWGTANAQTVTLSFWVRSSLTGTFSGSLRNSAADRSYVFTYSISAANTFEYKTITIVGDTSGTWLKDNGIGIRVWWSLGTGSNLSTGTTGSWVGGNFVASTSSVSVIGTASATFYITGVQLEAGSVATPFERRDYGRELMMCQRYYQEIGASADNIVVYQTYSNAVTTYYLPMAFPVPMRAAPTGTVAGTWTTATVSAFSVSAGANSFRLNITSTGVGNVTVQNNGAGSKLTFAIEL